MCPRMAHTATASHHAIFDFDMSTEFVGRTILGVDLGPEHAIS